MTARIPRPRPTDESYVLVGLDDAALADETLFGADCFEPGLVPLGRAVAQEVRRVSGACHRRVVVLPPGADATLCGLPFGDWERVTAPACALTRLAARFHPGERVYLAGDDRTGTLGSLAAALERRGCRVAIHEDGTFPLDRFAVARLVDVAA